MEKNRPLISVIVPVYNILEYLPRCVRSITAQTYTDLEILLVDDGSTDGTGALCDELGREDDRIRVIHKENGGSSSARNVGLDLAEGRYIGFVDSDDFIDPDMYALLYDALRDGDALVAQVGRDELDGNGNRLPDICVPPAETERVDREDFLRELLMHRGDCSFCTKLFARELLEGEGFPVGVLNEDFHLLLKLLDRVPCIVSLPRQAYHVFCRVGSNTRKESRESFSRVFADGVDNADMALALARDKYPGLVPVAVRFGVFQRLEYLLHIPIRLMTPDNRRYLEIVAWLRSNWLKGLCNPCLTLKNKLYLTLFVLAPRGIRTVHKRLKGL